MPKDINLMEVCGTHTMEIARAGIKDKLPEGIRLLSGPGCPVCVTPPEVIDEALKLTDRPEVVITTYGDMIRVPGSSTRDSLAARAARGADVRIVYSPMDALEMAEREQDKQIVFLGVGFETSAPGTAAAIAKAKEKDLDNFTVFSMLKRLEPSIKALAKDPDFNIDGFICPGHVAVILGEEGVSFFADDVGVPAVIAGFAPTEIAKAIAMLIKQIKNGVAKLENAYRSIVRPEGNPLAREEIEKYLIPAGDIWRGLGAIDESGFDIRDEFESYDAKKRFGIEIKEKKIETACRCGDVIRGKCDPVECPLFGKLCSPDEPEGPCMVSAEGACAAAYKYGDH